MAYIYDLTDTWNAGGTIFNAVKMNVTDTASASGSKLVTLQTNGTEHFSVTKAGVGYFSGNVGVGTASPINYTGFTTLDIDNGTNGGLLNIKKAGATVGYIHGGSGMLMLANATPITLSATGSNQVQFLTNAIERMRITGTGNVGINTSAPGGKLEIVDTTTVLRLNSTYAGGNFVDINPFVEGISNSGFSINVGGNIRQIIDASGNVGFGITPSPWVSSWRAIEVERGGALFGTLALSGIANNAYLDSGSSWRYKTSYGAATVSMASDGAVSINNAVAGTAGNVITFSTRIYVAPAGNVIIGGTTDYPVASDRTLSVAGSSFASLNLVCGGAFSGAGLTVDSAGELQIRNSGTERMRLKAGGQVRFFPLAAAPASPQAGDVYYDSTTNKLRCYNGTIWNDLF